MIESENLVERAAIAGKLFTDGLLALAEKYDIIDTVRGKGLMLGLILKEPAQELVQKIIEAGVLCIATADTVVRFLPPLNVKDKEIKQVLTIIEKCLEMKK